MGRRSKAFKFRLGNSACVVGYGMVGKATGVLFGVNKQFDTDKKKSNLTLKDAAKCKYLFLCLPTPVTGKGYRTLGILETIKKIEKFGFKGIYIIRSTVYPGFVSDVQKKLKIDRIVSNPEFLSEDTWEEDTKNPPFVLLGGTQTKVLNRVKFIYKRIMPDCRIIVTDNTTAELAKISMNSYFATKVIFANQIFDYSQKIGASYDTVKKILELHPYGPKNHFTIVYKGKRGVNGNCLPKDTRAMAFYSKLPLIKTVVRLNNILVKKSKK